MNIGISLTSSLDVGQEYIDLTEQVATRFAQKGYGIVYGGTSYGMMEKLAESYKQHEGKHLVGIVAEDLMSVTKNYRKFGKLDEEYVVKTMEERKTKIISLSDAYLILPGGYGSFEEIASVVGGQANKLFSKPIAFFNYKDYYKHLFEFFGKMYQSKFSRVNPSHLYLVSDNLEEILHFFENYSKKTLPDKFV